MKHLGSIILETDRLILRKLKIEDAQEIFNNWTSDSEVAKYVRWSTHKSIEETKQWLAEEEKNYKDIGYYTWGLELKQTRELIGCMSALYREEEDRYEIGYNLAKKYWNQKYTTEALKKVMTFLIDEVGIKKFKCVHAKLNPASGKVMQKVGFKYIKDGYFESYDKTKRYDSKIYYLDILEELELVVPTKKHEKELLEYVEEHFTNGEKQIHACSKLNKMDNYNEWLNLLEKNSKKETVSKDWTVTSIFLGVRKSDEKIIGMISIRHELTNDYLRNYVGHIGYGIRPSERKKGYATQMLSLGLKFCREELKLGKVMVNCHEENIGSKKTIINAGGILEREYIGEDRKKHSITLDKTIILM